jgi:hypothetical protein
MEGRRKYTVNWVESECNEMNWAEPHQLDNPEPLRKEEFLKEILDGMRNFQPMEQNWIMDMVKETTTAQRNERILQLEDELSYIKSTIK